ncbi:hypothetical protein ACKS2G_003363 [Cronobacter sakazakii]
MKDRGDYETMAELFQADSSYATGLLVEVVHYGNTDEFAILAEKDNPTSLHFTLHGTFHGFPILSYFNCMFYK